MKVAVIDYGCGNISSLKNALEYVGGQVDIISRFDGQIRSSKMILPGVGAFGFGMNQIRTLNLLDPLVELITEQKVPTLGICLGAQLLLQSSEESPGDSGLSLLKGEVVKFSPSTEYRVPHVGWDLTTFEKDSPFSNVGHQNHFYYTHSYFMRMTQPEDVVATCGFAGGFASVIQKAHIFGCQFHPEKSQQAGLTFLKTFLEL